MIRLKIVPLLLLLWPLSATAQDIAPAHKALMSGDYDQAYKLGLKIASAEGFSIACQAALITGGFYRSGDEAVLTLHRAIKACEQSVAIAPDDLDAKLSLAMATGFEGKRLRSPKLAKRSKKHLDQLLALYPESPVPYAALGGWHSQVSAAGLLARLVLGARPSKAKENFTKSEKYGLGDVAMRLEYIKMLIRCGKQNYPFAVKRLELLTDVPPERHLDSFLIEKSALLSAAMSTGKRKNITRAIKQVSAFNGIDKWRKIPPYRFKDFP